MDRAVYGIEASSPLSNAGIMGSNSTSDMDVCVHLFFVCAILCAVSGLSTDWSPIQGVLPHVEKDRETEKAVKVQQRAAEP
jgi:hypothetical protein